ncbi:beta-ketoacyl-[acyl-carrier-protein] synthase family protein [soil metagenome]
MHRVVITGMGCIGPLGLDVASTWQGMREGRSGVRPITGFAPGALRTRIAAQVQDTNLARHFDAKRLPLLDPVSQFALIAAREAVAQSGLDFTADSLGDRTAVILGTAVGGEATREDASRRLYGENNPRVHPFTIIRLMANAPASQLSMEFGLRGPSFAVASACASANHAMGQAMNMLRHGVAQVALTGGTEASLSLAVIKAWEAMRVLADDVCSPFSKQRRGLVLGEGAGIFVLETLEHAQARGATILAELAGSGMSSDATDIVLPDAGGAARAMQGALADAGLALQDIDYINAHGTGTTANDRTETRAIRQVFGAHANALAVSSTKSMHGHLLGAAGAIELLAVVGAMREGLIPPTINYTEPDPECDLDVVPNLARARPVRAALSNSFAFGGMNAAIAVKRWDGV